MAVTRRCVLCGHASNDQRYHGEEGHAPLNYAEREERVVTYAFTKPVYYKSQGDKDGDEK